MVSNEIHVGGEYAIREKAEDPPARVRVVAKAPKGGGHWKVRYLEGDLTGLEQWRRSGSLLCRWGEVAAQVRDERRLHQLRQAAVGGDAITCRAIDLVLIDASGEDQEHGFLNSEWHWHMRLPPARRLWQRAQRDGDVVSADRTAFVDRHGELHVSFEAVYGFARAFAA
jgi:hypothetical protein